MAELDDFFAKKDRKKPKGKKFATTDELAKKLEDTSKKIDVKTKRERTNQSNPEDPNDPNNLDQINEDEWKDFEEDEKKDYSNLKIGQLTINEEEQNQVNMGHDDMNYDGQSDGEGNSENTDRRPSGPWKKVSNSEAVVEQQQPPPTSQKSTSNVYISPALRNQMAQQNQRAGRLRNRIAPDLANEEYFPTLGTTSKQEVIKKKIDANFEEVKHGGRAQRTSDLPSNAPVITGNRFNSLDDD